MPIDQTGNFIPRQGGATQPYISESLADPIFYAQQNAAQTLIQSGQQLGGALNRQADTLARAAEQAQQSKNATDSLRMVALREDYASKLQATMQENANDPDSWTKNAAQLQNEYAQSVQALKLDPAVAETETIKDDIFWTKQQRTVAANVIKYSAARDRETVTSTYARLIESGDVEGAQALVNNPEYANIWRPGEREALIEEAPRKYAAYEVDVTLSSVKASESLESLEALNTELDAGEFSNWTDVQKNTVRAAIQSQMRTIETRQDKRLSDAFDFARQGEWLTDEQVDEQDWRESNKELYRLTRNNSIMEGEKKAATMRKAQVEKRQAALIAEDRQSAAYKSMMEQANKLLLNVYEDGADADINIYETLLNDASTNPALITAEARVDILNVVLRARAVDIQDGEVDQAGAFWDRDLGDDEKAYLKKFYDNMALMAERYQLAQEAGTSFMESEEQIHQLFSGDEQPTPEQLEQFMADRLRPLFNTAALQTLTTQQ